MVKSRDVIEAIARLGDEEQARVVRGLSPLVLRELNERWRRWAHKGQWPEGDDWGVWAIIAGRGFGKTRAGAEWIGALARKDGPFRIALVGATLDDVRKVMIEGESGLLATAHTGDEISYEPTKGEVRFGTGTIATAYSAENPGKLRGPAHHFAWCDEVAKWRHGLESWSNLRLGLRLGARPRILVTTTPRPCPLLAHIVALPDVIIRRGATRDNLHLAPGYLAAMQGQYGGTRLGRQELDGELIGDVEDALWSRDMIERRRVAVAPEMRRVVIGVDPPAGVGGDACGIVAVGLGVDGKAYVLGDHSVSGRSPEGWARAVAAAADVWRADRVIAEANQGGAMVETTLRAADVGMPVKLVHASRGKVARAEPVAALYEAGKAFHAGAFTALEDELCGLVSGGGYEGPGRSPDRADAAVWAMTELMLGKAGAVPQVRWL